MKLIFLAVFAFLQTSCVFWGVSEVPRQEGDFLTKEYAQERKRAVANVRYNLQFDLTDKEKFQGKAQVFFTRKASGFLSLDFVEGSVQKLFINQKPVEKINYNGYFVVLPEEMLEMGPNKIEIQFSHPYSKDGEGLYRYTDVKDQRDYLYTQFEPYKANRVFPCFDQPNLKATYMIQVDAPKTWQVVTSVRENRVDKKGEINRWSFPQSERFSTYTFSLHAGDYHVWEAEAETKYHKVPLRLMARKSLASYVDPEEWFELTRQSFGFFEKYFGMAYPYKKYDQLIVPDFNWGAMENVAAVTFNEDRFVSKGEKTRAQKRRLAATLFHEMAHMWFGNLVTMEWWDDLWLNESFATHSSMVGLYEATQYKEAWKSFNSRKQASYQTDMSINTHPIAMDAASTDVAFANFDAITYGKGASVMKQLSFLMGDKNYRKALKIYFEKYAHGNTRLSDFMNVMSSASGLNLEQWQERWLETAMLNEVEVHFTCSKSKIDNFEIFQTGTKEYPTLRQHKTQIAFFKKKRGVFKKSLVKDVEYSGGRTKVEKLIGKPCPDIVYPNFNDHDYVIVNLDKMSLKNIESSLASIEDNFLRSVLWSDLWRMTLNSKIPMDRFLEIVEFNGLNDEDLQITNKVLGNVNSILHHYYPDQGTPWREDRKVWIKFFEQSYMTRLQEELTDSERQKTWFRNLIGISESPEIFTNLVNQLNGRKTPWKLTFKVDQDMRWGILSKLAQYDHAGIRDLVEKELKRDPSKRGVQRSTYAKSLYPELENKKTLFNQVASQPKDLSFGFLRSIMFGLFPTQQENLHRKFVDAYYASLKKLARASNKTYATTFARALVPAFCDQKSSNQIESFIKAEKGLSFPIVKSLRGSRFENDRCYSMRKVLKEKSKRPRASRL